MSDLPDGETRPIDAAPEPARIGRYELLERIGKGGMGVVYRARDTMLGRMVAVKMLVSEVEVSAESRERFFREARAAGQLGHRNIITIYDFGEENGHAFIVMELLQGENLTSLLAREPTLPLEQCLDIMMRVCEGLAFAHSRAIVHRDIKPANLFVTTDNQIKILDFGVARIASSNLTKSGLIVGTPEYMSPEQVRGRTVDQRSDIFSAGAVFYQLLGGRKPFAARALPQVMQKVVSEDPAPLGDAEAPPDLRAIIARALEKDPDRRYQQIQEMLADLARFVQTYERGTRELALKAYDRYREVERMLADRVELARAIELQVEPAGVAVAPLLQDLPLFQEIGGDVLRVVPFRRGRVTEILQRLETQHEELVTSNAAWRSAVAALDAAAARLAAGDGEGATAALEPARTAVPDSPRVARVMEKIQAASAAARNRAAVEGLVVRAAQAIAGQDLAAADVAVAAILNIDPDAADGRRLRDQIDQIRATAAAREAQRRRMGEVLASARERFAGGDRRAAIELLQTLAADLGGVSEIDAELARLMEEDRRLSAIERRREEAGAKAEAAAAAFRAGHVADALRLAEEALQIDADNEKAVGVRADASARQEALEAARHLARKIGALVQKGQRLLANGSLRRAERVAREAVEGDPDNAAAGALLASVMRAKLTGARVERPRPKGADDAAAQPKAPETERPQPRIPAASDSDRTIVVPRGAALATGGRLAPNATSAAAADGTRGSAARQTSAWRPSMGVVVIAAAVVLLLAGLAMWMGPSSPASQVEVGSASTEPPSGPTRAATPPAAASSNPAALSPTAAPEEATSPSLIITPSHATALSPTAAPAGATPEGSTTGAPPRPPPSAGPGVIPAVRRPNESLAAWRRRSKELTDRYTEGKTALDASDFARAISILSQVLDEEPGYADAASLIESARAGTRAAQRTHAEAALQEGQRREKSDDLTGALASYRDAQRLDGDFEPPRAAAAALAQRMKTLAQDVLRRANAEDAFGRVPEAIALYKRAIELLPDDDAARLKAQQRLDALQGIRR